MQKMATGALIVAASYLLVAGAEAFSGATPAHWLWLLTFFLIFTLGELYILPNGLGIFARLAPPKLGASTVAAWYLAIFAGSLVAGQVGRLWSHLDHVQFFLLLAAIATVRAVFLYLLDRPTKAVLANARPADRDLTDVPEELRVRQCVTATHIIVITHDCLRTEGENIMTKFHGSLLASCALMAFATATPATAQMLRHQPSPQADRQRQCGDRPMKRQSW